MSIFCYDFQFHCCKKEKSYLTIEKKLDVLKKKNTPRSILSCSCSGVWTRKIHCFRHQEGRKKILKFSTDPSCLKKRCIVRKANDEVFDNAMHLWFTQERLKGTPLSGTLVMEKARMLYSQLYPGKSEDDFKASTGWLQRFKQRHGIRQLRLQGETLSADTAAAEEFVKSFQEYIEEHQLSMNQVFNCDETGLYWRLLPNKTLS